MLGNLFGPKKPDRPEEELPQSQAPVSAQGASPVQQGMTAMAPGVVGSKLNPALRQNLSALSHLDSRTTQVLRHSQQEAAKARSQHIEPLHLLLGLLYDEQVFKVFEEFSVDIAKLSQEIQGKQPAGNFMGQPTLSSASQQLFEEAYRDAKKRGAEFITPEDVLLTLFAGNIQVAAMLQEKGITKDKVTEKLTKTSPAFAKGGKKSVLEEYGVDLTEEARTGKLDPITGRDKEIERMVHILLRRTKNNPVIIGEAGVGKTAIIEGVAQQIASGNVPKELQGRRIIQLDLSSLVAGASHRGEFEERLRSVIKEAMASSGQIVLFIDEIHTVMGAGDEGGAMDASNIIKPHLARGHLQIIGTTTTTEYRKYFEKDKAFERRFQPILCEEPDEENAIKMLQILKPKYEKFHGVTITDEAIEAAVKLSKKYIGERYLPDKGVDLLDEAAAEVKLAHGGQRAVPNRTEEEKVMDEEHAAASQEAKDTEEKKTDGEAAADQKVDGADVAKKDDTGAEATDSQKQDALQAGAQSAEGGAERDASDSSKEPGQAADATKKDGTDEKTAVRSDAQVTRSDIEKVVSSWTGIPITKLTEDEGQKLLKLEDRIHQRLIDQEEAVKAVSEAVRRGRIGLAAANRPIASFIFLGPTGTGKTELAKTLAEILFGKDDAMVRLDMSEYMEKHEVAKLIGAPPGYVGYEEGGQLTEAVRAKPYSIVLLDEVEKAHPDVFNILLQLLEDGRLTDNKGNTISFKNTIVICTSNIGSQVIQQKLSQQAAGGIKKTEEQKGKDFKELESLVNDELHKFFRPELLNRFDDTVIFKPLQAEHMLQIAKLGIQKTGKLLKEQGYSVDITDAGLAQLAKEGYDPAYGARPLRRLIQTAVENPIALQIISKQFAQGDTIVIDYDAAKNEYVFKKGEKKVDAKEAGEHPGVTPPSPQVAADPSVTPGQSPQAPGGAGQVQQMPPLGQGFAGQAGVPMPGQPQVSDPNQPLVPGSFGVAQDVSQGALPDPNMVAMQNMQQQYMGVNPVQASVPQGVMPDATNGMIQPSFDVSQVIDPQQMTPPPPQAGGNGMPMSSSFAAALASLKERE